MHVTYRFAIGRALCIFALLILVGCDDRAWNDPYPNLPPKTNTLFTAFTIQPKTLDPAKSYSENEWIFIGNIYESVLEYNYLLRPYRLQPLLATKMPEPKYDIATDTSTYVIEIKPGVMYQPHPAFARNEDDKYSYLNLTPAEAAQYNTLKDFKNSGTRELKAADFVYQIKRLADPKINSPVFGFLNPYLPGLIDLRDTLAKDYKLYQPATELDMRNYEMQGLKVIDDYKYEITINGKYPQFKYWLQMTFFCPMPWEAIRFYAQPGFLEHNISIDWYPVGTGAYYLIENNPDRRLEMVKNPNFHEDYYPSVGEPEDAAKGLLAAAGQRMPFIDNVVFSLEKESIPYWDKFMQGFYDRSGITPDNFSSAITSSGGQLQLTPQLLAKKQRLSISTSQTTTYWAFNMLDDTVGGYSEKQKKLRQAISLAFDVEEYIVIFTNGRGIVADGPIPPGIFGYDPVLEGERLYNLPLAKQILAEAGYPGGRDPKTGTPLQIYFEAASSGDPDEKARFGWMVKQLEKLGIDLIVRATDYNRFMDKVDSGNAQMFLWGWVADYPDPENFLFMFYSKNGKVKFGGENASNYSNPKFDELFERFKSMENTPERLKLIEEMVAIVREDMPWIWGMFPQLFVISNPWAGVSKPNAVANNTLKYVKTDPQLRDKLQIEWNKPLLWPLFAVLLLLVIIIMPAVIVYNRKENLTAKRLT